MVVLGLVFFFVGLFCSGFLLIFFGNGIICGLNYGLYFLMYGIIFFSELNLVLFYISFFSNWNYFILCFVLVRCLKIINWVCNIYRFVVIIRNMLLMVGLLFFLFLYGILGLL